jgi:hypothetical protein
VLKGSCGLVNSRKGRCVVWEAQWNYGTGYGYGGYDYAVWRFAVFAYRLRGREYSTSTDFIDYLDPWYWVRSDMPRASVPKCYGNYY